MRKFLIAGHGSFSSGLQSSLEIIIGKTENLFILDAYVDNNQSIENELDQVLATVKVADELVVFADLMGGSITNQILRYAWKENVHLVAGTNLPLLIDILMADEATPVTEVIENALAMAREQLVYVNKLINKEIDND
jgi:fructoselysine and glucoselysine-specific PTS system IIA component